MSSRKIKKLWKNYRSKLSKTRHQLLPNFLRNKRNFSYKATDSGADGFKFGLDDDCPTENIARILEPTLHVINTYHKQKRAVMVHCLDGKSRSVVVCMAYMIKFCNETWHSKSASLLSSAEPTTITLESAYAKIKSLRPQIDVFPTYLIQLRKWQQLRCTAPTESK